MSAPPPPPTDSRQQTLSVSWDEIKAVQNLIERCLQQYMTQTEIIAALQVQANIEPSLTCLVWTKLEEQNPDFFFSYDVKLRLKDQIVAFNYLVEQQFRLLQKLALAIPGQVRRARRERRSLAPRVCARARARAMSPRSTAARESGGGRGRGLPSLAEDSGGRRCRARARNGAG